MAHKLLFAFSDEIFKGTRAENFCDDLKHIISEPFGLTMMEDRFNRFSLHILQFPVILIGYTILYLKPSMDILQGLNKLDYTLTVSKFQKPVDSV